MKISTDKNANVCFLIHQETGYTILHSLSLSRMEEDHSHVKIKPYVRIFISFRLTFNYKTYYGLNDIDITQPLHSAIEEWRLLLKHL